MHSEDIVIRPYQIGDAPLLFEAATESVAEVYRWLPWCHPGYSIGESEAWVEHSMRAWADETEFNFVIQDRARPFLGGTGINQKISCDRIANLGYWVRTSAARRGVATAAVRLTAQYAFEKTNLVRLEIVVAVENPPSLRVAEKVGAVREGIAHDRIFAGGESHDAVVHALLRSRVRPPSVAV